MNLNNPFGKRDEIYGYQTLHREIGNYIARLEQYKRSLQFFDEAIEKSPDDLRALIGRSRARAKAVQYDGAMDDINNALKVDPDDFVLLADKAFNTYLCCEFEEGLVQNFRLLPKRQKPDVFSMGVMQCTDAIENCVGDRTGRPLRDHFKIIRKLAWKKNYAAQKPFEPVPRMQTRKKKCLMKRLQQLHEMAEPVTPKKIKTKKHHHYDPSGLRIKDSLHSKPSDHEPIPRFTNVFPFGPLQDHTTNIENYMAEKYLDSMYLDKIFLKNLPNNSGAGCPNANGTKNIKQLAKDCFKTVSYKQELLRARRPFYFIKYQEARVSGHLRERQKMELEHQQMLAKKEADSLLNRMLEAYKDKKLKLFLDILEKLKRYCDSKPKKLLPEKQIYMNEIHDKVCKAFYEVHRTNPRQNHFEQNKRIYAILGLPLSRTPSRDSVIAQFKNVFVDYRKEINLFKTRLEEATTSEEICWFYYELSRYHLEVKLFDLARVYANKCIKEAKDIDHKYWVFNSAMLMTKCDLQEHNKNDARNDLNVALKYAEALQDEDKIEYVHRCMDIVEQIEFEDIYGSKELEKRENTIIRMMASSKMKDEVSHLFRQMAAMPVNRRMTVIPGVRASASKGRASQSSASKKSRHMSRKMSIMPAQRDADESLSEIVKTASKRNLGNQTGRAVMSFIEFHV